MITVVRIIKNTNGRLGSSVANFDTKEQVSKYLDLNTENYFELYVVYDKTEVATILRMK